MQSGVSCSTDYDQSLRGTNQQNQKPESLIAKKSLRLSGQICTFENYLEVREASKGRSKKIKLSLPTHATDDSQGALEQSSVEKQVGRIYKQRTRKPHSSENEEHISVYLHFDV